MGYILTLVAVLCSAVKGYFGKGVSAEIKTSSDAVLISTVRMAICSAIGFVIILFSGNLSQFKIETLTLPIFILSGASTALFIIFWLLSVKGETFVLLEAFTSAGVIVPIFLSIIFLGEPVKLTQILGVIFIIVAVTIMSLPSKGVHLKISVKSLLSLSAAGAACGMCDFSQSLYITKTAVPNITAFNFYTYLFSTLILFVFLLVTFKKSTTADTKRNSFAKILGYVSIMALAMFVYSFVKTKAAISLSSAILYPLYQGLWLITTFIISAVFFKEKVTAKNIIGISITFIALLIINLL